MTWVYVSPRGGGSRSAVHVARVTDAPYALFPVRTLCGRDAQDWKQGRETDDGRASTCAICRRQLTLPIYKAGAKSET